MPKKVKIGTDFTKANVRVSTKKIINQITEEEGLFEYELIDKLLRECRPKYFRKSTV